jgi:putative endonuclease
MLSNVKCNVLYTGVTANLKERLYLHKKRLVPGFTKKYNVDRLMYFESFSSIEAARERERQLKGKSRAKKNAIIEASNPLWFELEPPKEIEIPEAS